MIEDSATASLANYICHSELGSSPTDSPIQTVTTSTTRPAQDTITKQLNDLAIQFKNGIKNIQNVHCEPKKEDPVILRSSFSMPHLPIFSDKLLTENTKYLKKSRREQPRPISPATVILDPVTEDGGDCHNMGCFRRHSVATECVTSTSCTTSSSSTSHSVSPSKTMPSTNDSNPSSISMGSASARHHSAKMAKYGGNMLEYKRPSPSGDDEEGGNQAINQKLDLLIHLLDSQQKLLQNVVNESKRDRKEKRVDRERQSQNRRESANTVQTVAICKGTQTQSVDQSTQTAATGVTPMTANVVTPKVPAVPTIPAAPNMKPHILQSGAPSAMQSPFTKYPPIPESQSASHGVGGQGNISVPYETLMKLMVAATNKPNPHPVLVTPPPPYPAPNNQFMFDTHNLKNRRPGYHHRGGDHEIDCNSTLHFSDC